MRRRLRFITLLLALPASIPFVGSCTRPTTATAPTRIVYAGPPGAAATESYRRFLSRYFSHVRVIPVADLATADLSRDDVLIVGGSYKDAGPKGVSLNTLSIPTILIGGMGGKISDNLDLKLGWRYG